MTSLGGKNLQIKIIHKISKSFLERNILKPGLGKKERRIKERRKKGYRKRVGKVIGTGGGGRKKNCKSSLLPTNKVY